MPGATICPREGKVVGVEKVGGGAPGRLPAEWGSERDDIDTCKIRQKR